VHSSSFKSLKTEDMRLKLKKGLELFSKSFEANYHSFASSVFCIAPFLLTLKKIFVALQFARPMIQKSLNLVKE
jgi:hypothetical protein